jgi:DNA-binding MurR/RpiR family transcriptional regulator
MSFGERIGLLSVKRQEPIRPIQEHPRDSALLSIRDVASTLQSDPATILRIVGFQSYREFKAYLHELSIATTAPLEGLKTGSRINSGLATQGRQVLERDIQNLQALRHTLDMDPNLN